jgi:cyanophycinase
VTEPGTLALVGGREWNDACRDFDAALLRKAGTSEVVVVPAAAAFEQPDAVVESARRYFDALGASVRALSVLHREDAEAEEPAAVVSDAAFVYLSGGSPMHLRSVLMHSRLYEALIDAHGRGAVLAASGAGGRVLCDPMVDPRGGAYTVGLGLVSGLAFFPFHDSAPAHLWERSVDLLPREAVLAGVDEQTAMVRAPDGTWTVAGPGRVTIYDDGTLTEFGQDSVIDTLKM